MQLEQDKHKHRQADKKHQMGSELIAIYSKKVRKIKITQKWRITDQMEAKITFLTDADQDRVSPKKTMKKKGPHRSQSLKALPGSSL